MISFIIITHFTWYLLPFFLLSYKSLVTRNSLKTEQLWNYDPIDVCFVSDWSSINFFLRFSNTMTRILVLLLSITLWQDSIRWVPDVLCENLSTLSATQEDQMFLLGPSDALFYCENCLLDSGFNCQLLKAALLVAIQILARFPSGHKLLT